MIRWGEVSGRDLVLYPFQLEPPINPKEMYLQSLPVFAWVLSTHMGVINPSCIECSSLSLPIIR
jgi:hypothetical protein